MPNKPGQIYQIKVTLNGTRPPVWRRIQVLANTTLLKLHDILQIVMGWQDYHLHLFTIEGITYGDPADDEFGDMGTLDEASFKLNQVIDREGQRLGYEYDFGDGWQHTLLVEKILPSQEGVRYPICLKGSRACPPEDVGGVWGYQHMLEAIRNPGHEEHEEYLTWIGGDFDPAAFDLAEVNAQLRSMGRGRSTEASSPWPREDDESVGLRPEPDAPGPALLSEDQIVAENLPLRRDVIVLLTYLRDNKVTGTPSLGNLTLKAVREICARLVEPPQLEAVIGGQVFRVRSETDVWPLYFRHVLAAVGGLVTGGPSRRWKLTPLGERFLAAPAPWQVWFLLATWWTRTNWAVASAHGFEDGRMPPAVVRLALTHLLAAPVEEPTSFVPFADSLIQDAGLYWPIEDRDSAQLILRIIMEHTVISPLVDFGIVQPEYEPHPRLGAGFRELSTFRITAFGRRLLEGIREATR